MTTTTFSVRVGRYWRTTSDLAIANSHPLSENDLRWLWQQVEISTGYAVVAATPFPEGAGAQYQLDNGEGPRVVTLLVPSTVLAFSDVSRLIRVGIDTIVGSTGYSVFSSRDLAATATQRRPRGSPSNNDLNVTSVGKREGRFAHQFARIERLLTFRDVGQQNIHERTLAVERRTAPVLGNDNPLDRCKIELAERIVLYPKQTSSPSIGLSRDPTIHDPPAYECLDPLRSIPAMKQQSVHIVRPFVDGKRCQRHEARASSIDGGLARLQGKGKDWQREKPGEPLGVFLAASLNV